METYGDTFKYKKVCRDRDWTRIRRLWKPLEIHANIKLYGESGRDERRLKRL